MAIATQNPACKTQAHKTPYTTPEFYKSIALEHRKVDLSSAISCAEGSPWDIESYFNQRLEEHDGRSYGDNYLSPSYQAYVHIKDFVIYVTNGLSSEIDPEDHEVDVTGTGIIYLPVRVHVGDAFVADMTDAFYLFNVTEVRLRSYRSKTAYEIQYKMVCPIDEEHPKYIDLIAKSTDVLTVNKVDSDCNQTALVTEDESDELDALRTYYDGFLELYLRLFLDPDTDTLIYEQDDKKYHDRFLTDFVLSTFLFDRCRDAWRVRQISPVHSDRRFTTLFDLLLDPKFIDIMDVTREIYVLRKESFPYNTSITNIRYLTIEYLAVFENEVSSDVLQAMSLFGDSMDIACLYQDTIEVQGGVHIGIKPVFIDNNYVLSDAFYKDGEGKSFLEVLIKRYLNGESISKTEVLSIMGLYKKWNDIEKYYYTPLLMLLIRYTIQLK